MQQDELIRRFVTRYNECQDFNYHITGWPDKENRNSRDCDAYAEALGAPPLAIEHTLVQTFQDQKLDSVRFDRICGELERELKNSFDFDIDLVIPTFAIQPGTDWDAIRVTLREWLMNNVPTLPMNCSDHQVPGVPFRITMFKGATPPGSFRVSRWVPPDLESRRETVQIVANALADKNDQMSKYRASGAQKVLLLESDDIALANPATLYMAFLMAHTETQTPNIDQAWMARSYLDHCSLNCFLGPERVMNAANPANCMFGPQYREYWTAEMQIQT